MNEEPSKWTSSMITARIREIEFEFQKLQRDYQTKTDHLRIELEKMYKLQSNDPSTFGK